MTRDHRYRSSHSALGARVAGSVGVIGLALLGLFVPAVAHADVAIGQDGALSAQCSDEGFRVVVAGDITLDIGDTIDSYVRVDGLADGEHQIVTAVYDDFIATASTSSIVITDEETHLVEWVVNEVVHASGEFSAASCASTPEEPEPVDEAVTFGDAVCTADGDGMATATVRFSADAPAGAVAQATVAHGDSTETFTGAMDSERGAVVGFPLGAETPTVVTVVARLSDDVVTPLGERVYEALVDCVEPTPAPVPTPTETPSSTPTAPPSQNGGDTAPTSTPASSGVTTPVEQVEPPKLKPTVTLSSTAASAGGNVTVKARGFAPGEKVEIWLHSDPWKLADAVADANGTLTLRVGIAGGTDLGAHRIEVRGASSGSVYVKMLVNDDLAITGIDSAFASGVATTGVVLVLGGAAVFLLARRARLIANC